MTLTRYRREYDGWTDTQRSRWDKVWDESVDELEASGKDYSNEDLFVLAFKKFDPDA